MGKRIDTAFAANTYQGAPGGSGHFQDTTPPTFTRFDAQWCEGIQENVYSIMEGLGGTLDGTESDQTWALLGPRVLGQFSHATDTNVVTTDSTRVVVASTNSRDQGDDSMVAACEGCTNSGARAALIGSKNARLVEDDCIAWGNGAAAPGTGAVNVDLTGKVNTDTGNVHLEGVLRLGGDVDAGTGATASIDGSTGIVQAGGGFEPPTSTATAADGGGGVGGGPWTATANNAGGTVTVPFAANPLAAGALTTVTITNNKVDAGSRVHVDIDFAGGNGFPSWHTIQAVGSFQVVIKNTDPAIAIGANLKIHFDVMCPA